MYVSGNDCKPVYNSIYRGIEISTKYDFLILMQIRILEVSNSCIQIRDQENIFCYLHICLYAYVLSSIFVCRHMRSSIVLSWNLNRIVYLFFFSFFIFTNIFFLNLIQMYVVFVIYDIRLLFANTFSLGCVHMYEWPLCMYSVCQNCSQLFLIFKIDENFEIWNLYYKYHFELIVCGTI